MNAWLIGHDEYNCRGWEAKGQRSRCAGAGGVTGRPRLSPPLGLSRLCVPSLNYLSVHFSSYEWQGGAMSPCAGTR